jgi:hypothetical protein
MPSTAMVERFSVGFWRKSADDAAIGRDSGWQVEAEDHEDIWWSATIARP